MTAPPEAAVSFAATSNEAALVATTLAGQPNPLGEIIKLSAAFQRAFMKGDEKDGLFGSTGDNPQNGPKPTVIAGSGHGREVEAYPARWGLVSAAVEAYNRHHELVLRPDDVWQAVLTQFSFYVNANAEALRDRLVDFQGKKTLVVTMDGSLFTADYARFASRMVDESIVKNIKDPSVASWLLPDFSTTTPTDRVAASVSVMSTVQAYFEYVCRLMCGIPRVTLLGTVQDWRRLRAKIDRLPEFDLEQGRMAAWHRLLAPVLDQLVASAEGRPSMEFWDKICSREGGGSGPTYLSGWVTVFAAFTCKGEWQGEPREGPRGRPKGEWPRIDTNHLPVGVLAVPVLVDDNGIQYDTHMLSGQFAYEACGDAATALRPRTDWCIAYKGEAAAKAELRDYCHGEVRPNA